MESDTQDNTRIIAESIFKHQPRIKDSIKLELEEITADYAQNNKSGVDSFIEEILCNIIYHGVKIIFNYNKEIVNIPFNTITVGNFTILLKLLTQSEIYLLQEYVMSFGYKIKFRNDIYYGFENVI
jgi:cellulose synthase/poly-beta-1,6-N-acetylglucosamine synthase-like glycosyltransferase